MRLRWVRTLGEKLMDAGNLGFGGLIVGQVVAQSFQMNWMIFGVLFWLGGYLVGAYLIWLQERLHAGFEQKEED